MSREVRLRAMVDTLCSKPFAGRRTGSAEGRAARKWITGELEALGVEPLVPGYVQDLPRIRGGNVLGRIGGASERTILVAAHYDHLGTMGGETFWGADDNAAAVAILLEVGRALSGRALGKKVVLAFFDAEEPPHFLSANMGSQSFVHDRTIPLESIDMMICMDLVGHAIGSEAMPADVRRSVFALGAEKSGFGASVDRVASRIEGAKIRRLGGDVIPPLSDYQPFDEAGVPWLFLTCGRWSHYHAPTDTPDRLDYEKMSSTVELLSDLVGELSTEPPRAFDPDGRDDRASVSSVRSIAALLRSTFPNIDRIERVLDELDEAIDRRGRLEGTDREALAAMVERIESALSATEG